MDRIKPGSYNTQKLAAEAAAMEARLTALKLQLQKDKAQREAAAAAGVASAVASGGKCASIWSNGQQGPLKRPPAGSATASGPGRAAAAQPPARPARTPSARSSISSSSRTQSVHAGAASTISAAESRSTRPPAAAHLAGNTSTVPAKLGSFKESSRSPSISSTPSSANTRPTSTSSTSSSGSLDTKRSDTPTKAAAGKPQWPQQLRQQHQQESSSLRQPSTAQGAAQHGLAAQQVESWNQGLAAEDEARNQEAGVSEQHDESSLLDGAYDETQAVSSFQEALLQWRQAGTTGCHNNNTSSNSGGGCGPEPRQHHEQSLLHGTYDEAAATGSFQEALKQWRQAGPAAGTGTSTSTSASCAAGSSARSSQAQQCTQQHSSSTSTAANTASGTGPPSRPINNSVAAFLQKLTTRTTNNSNTGPAGSSLVATSPSSALPQGYSEAAAALNTLADSQLVVAPSGSSSQTPSTGPDMDGVSCQEGQPRSGSDDAPVVSCNAGGTEDDLTTEADAELASEPFEAWLQQAEQTAAMLAAAAASNGTGTSDALQLPVSRAAGGSTDAAPSAPPSAATSMYHQKLEGMLQAVEQLESELQDRVVPVRLAKTLGQ